MPRPNPLPRPRVVLSDEVLDTIVANSLVPPEKNNQATYIAELGNVNPEQAGMAVYDRETGLTFRGTRKNSNNPDGTPGAARQDADVLFSIQSMSKLFNAAYLGNNSPGRFALLKATTGVDPSSNAFNIATMESSDQTKPANAFENIGALAVAAAMTRTYPGENTAQRLADWLTEITGANPPIRINMQVADSEFNDALNNQKLLRQLEEQSPHIMDGLDRMEVLRNYCMQCSIEMSCAQLAKAASIFVEGKHPDTGVQILSPTVVQRCQVMMHSAGGYNQNLGAKTHQAYLKSGVGGGLVGITDDGIPFATFSPRLNGQGNSVEGIKMLKEFTSYNITSPQILRNQSRILKTFRNPPLRTITRRENRRQESGRLQREALANGHLAALQGIVTARQAPGGLDDDKRGFYMKEWSSANINKIGTSVPNPTPAPVGSPTSYLPGKIPLKGSVLYCGPDTRPNRPNPSPNDVVAYVRIATLNRAATHIAVLHGDDAKAAQAVMATHQARDASKAADKLAMHNLQQQLDDVQTRRANNQFEIGQVNAQEYRNQNQEQIAYAIDQWAQNKFTYNTRIKVNLHTASEIADTVRQADPAFATDQPAPGAVRKTRPQEWEVVSIDRAHNTAVLVRTYDYHRNTTPIQKREVLACVMSLQEIEGHTAEQAGHALLEVKEHQRYMLSFDKLTRKVEMNPSAPTLTAPTDAIRTGRNRGTIRSH